MRGINLFILVASATVLTAACSEKGGNSCAAPGCETEAAIIREKCKTLQKIHETGQNKSINFQALNNEVRSNAVKSAKLNDNTVRTIMTSFSSKNNALLLGQELGQKGELTRDSLIEESTLAQHVSPSDKSVSNSSFTILNCGDTQKGRNPKALPLVQIREGLATMTAIKKAKVTVELTADSLNALNQDRDPLNRVDKYTVTIQRKKAKGKQAELDEAAGTTEVIRTSKISLVDIGLAQALKDAGNDLEMRKKIEAQHAATGLPSGPAREVTIIEKTRTHENLSDELVEKVSGEMLSNVVADNGTRTCKILPPAQLKGAKGNVEVLVEDLKTMNEKLQKFLSDDICDTDLQTLPATGPTGAAESAAQGAALPPEINPSVDVIGADGAEEAAPEAAGTGSVAPTGVTSPSGAVTAPTGTTT